MYVRLIYDIYMLLRPTTTLRLGEHLCSNFFFGV